MANQATLAFHTGSGKWVATYAGNVIASSANREYVISAINSGRCTKAKIHNVTSVRVIGDTIPVQTTSNTVSGETEKMEKFGINERFGFLEEFIRMVADRTSPSLVITGEGGLGKTFTVNKALAQAGLENSYDKIGMSSDCALTEMQSRFLYTVVKGYSTAKGLFRTLYENRNRVIVFDDCDSVLKDGTAVMLLKAALDSYERRIITWNAESFGPNDDLPRSFEFTGGVIFISNLPIFKVDQAIRSRAICVDVSMNTAQKIERMAEIIKDDNFLPGYELSTKQQALEFLDRMKNEAKELNLRTLISVTKVAGRGNDWERRAEYLLTSV